jgi:hypothetical protein
VGFRHLYDSHSLHQHLVEVEAHQAEAEVAGEEEAKAEIHQTTKRRLHLHKLAEVAGPHQAEAEVAGEEEAKAEIHQTTKRRLHLHKLAEVTTKRRLGLF